MKHRDLKRTIISARACIFVAMGEVSDTHPAYQEMSNAHMELSKLLEEVEQMPLMWNQQVMNALNMEDEPCK